MNPVLIVSPVLNHLCPKSSQLPQDTKIPIQNVIGFYQTISQQIRKSLTVRLIGLTSWNHTRPLRFHMLPLKAQVNVVSPRQRVYSHCGSVND